MTFIAKLLTIALLFGCIMEWGTAGYALAAGNTYYVSPAGSDGNPGTEAQPWATMAMAAATLQAGDTAIFEDGVYEETEVAHFANSGSAAAPITLKARNKHGAVLQYVGLNHTSKLVLSSRSHIVLQDFEITQDVKGTVSVDGFIDSRNSSAIGIIGNRIHGAGGKGVVGTGGGPVTIEGNELFDLSGQGILLKNMDSPVIRNNALQDIDVSAIGIMSGTRDARIYNNVIHTGTTFMRFGILLGANSRASSSYDPDGYEAYHAAAWNNTIISDVPGMLQSGVGFLGSLDSAFINNVVAGSQYGVRFAAGGLTTESWSPLPTNSIVKNNIFSDIVGGAQLHSVAPVNLSNDHNLYFNTADEPIEPNGVYADPKFVAAYTDLRLQSDSPAVGSGEVIALTGFDGLPIDVSHDAAGEQRTASWDLGIYAEAATAPSPTPIPDPTPTPAPTSNPVTDGTVVFTDDFESGDGQWTVTSGSMAAAEETPGGNQAYTQPDASVASGVAKATAGSLEWESYAVDLRVNFRQFYHKNGFFTLYTRHTDSQNYYLLEMKGHPETGYIGLKKKVGGVVIPLQEKLEWNPSPGWHNLKFTVNGTSLQVHMDGHLLLSGSDAGLSNGGIAAAIFRSDILIDDVTVTEIEGSTVPGGPGDPRPEPGGTYYVSPDGDDENPGTEAEPWRTMYHAAYSAQRGDTVIFEDGLYEETRVAYFEESGTETEPILFKSRNKHGAVIKYMNMPTTKIYIRGKSYITLQDFEITQNRKGVDTTDILIRVVNDTNYIHIIGNKIHHAFEDGVKGSHTSNMLVEGNYIYDITHEGVDFVNVKDSTMRNNEVYDVERNGLLAKGGSENILIYNNYVHNANVMMRGSGIYLGGQTDPVSTADPSVNGFEMWNGLAYNNVVISELPGLLRQGITFMGSKDSAAYNNIVIGAKYNIHFWEPNNVAIGWDWNPPNVNAVFKNNIIVGATVDGLGIVQTPDNLVHDHNLYYGNATEPSEANGVYGDPLLADPYNGNWHLGYGSPAIDAGEVIAGFMLKDGTLIDVSHDYDGAVREADWDMGIYRGGEPSASPAVFLIGDSTMADFPAYRSPLTGWGTKFKEMFDDAVTVYNYGSSGHSSKSYLDMGQFAKTELAIEDGDYLFIQFGHNDQSTLEYKHTEPFTTYKDHLKYYIQSARAKGAIPVLLTSMNRRQFHEDGTLIMSLGDYPVAVREMASELNVPVIDFNATSKTLYEQLGPELTKELFLWLEPGESPNYPDGKQDNTHFNELGAAYFAHLAAEGIKQLGLPLAEHIEEEAIAAPITVAAVSGQQGDNGWYTSEATVEPEATSDERTAIAYTEYKLTVIESVYGISLPPTEGYVAYTSSIVLPDGVYELSFRSVDLFGNVEERQESEEDLRIQVDTIAPTLDVTLDRTELWPPNHELVAIHADVAAEDTGSGVRDVMLSGIAMNESDDGGDIVANIGSADTSFQLRSERDGGGTGRIYTVAYTATDEAGNAVTTQRTVTVPHHR